MSWKKVLTYSRSQEGFSMAELLVTTIILVLASAIMAAGVPAAFTAYRNVMDASNAQLLLSTATVRLRDELSVADPSSINWDANPASTLTFQNLETRYQVTISSDDTDGIKIMSEYEDYGDPSEDPTPRSEAKTLVAQNAGMGAGSNTSMIVKFDSIVPRNGAIIVNNLMVVRPSADGSDPKVLAGGSEEEPLDLKIRVLAQPR